MRIGSSLFFALMMTGLACILWMGGCSEDDPVQVDETSPTIEIRNPDAKGHTSFAPLSIEDSIDIVVWADDPSGIDAVEIMCTFQSESDSAATLLATLTTPDSAKCYSYHWVTAALDNGIEGVIWARATDEVGNKGRTQEGICIRVINSGEMSAPDADFIIVPNSGGTVATRFKYDPSPTADALDSNEEILVRWDFEGDGFWDVDTTDGRTAAEPVYHTYSTPGNYEVRLQAFNTYYPAPSEVAVRPLRVASEWGEPDTLISETVLVPAGIYPIGVVEIEDGPGSGYNHSELLDDTLFVRISGDVRIDKYEVTNRLFVDFLNAARDSGQIEYEFALGGLTVRSVESGKVLLYLNENDTRVAFIDEEHGFNVKDEFANHPVTGVTWDGARGYAGFYGRRIPTEAEWEIATRGDLIETTADTTFFYPWQPTDMITGFYANFRDSGDPYEANGNVRATTPIGSYNGDYMGAFPTENAVGPFGTYDQAGNVAEWVLDWFDNSTYGDLLKAYKKNNRPPIDPFGPQTGTFRVVRGGSFFETKAELRVTCRSGWPPEEASAKIGFRTAYTDFD